MKGRLFQTLTNDTYKLCVCVKRVFHDVEKTGETDFFEKPKSIYYMDILYGRKLAVPKKVTSSNPTHFGREGSTSHIIIYASQQWSQ